MNRKQFLRNLAGLVAVASSAKALAELGAPVEKTVITITTSAGNTIWMDHAMYEAEKKFLEDRERVIWYGILKKSDYEQENILS